MNITVRYSAQARQAAGQSVEEVQLPDSCTLTDLLLNLAHRHGDPMRRLLLDTEGQPHPSVLIFINENQANTQSRTPLKDQDTVILLSPISGG